MYIIAYSDHPTGAGGYHSLCLRNVPAEVIDGIVEVPPHILNAQQVLKEGEGGRGGECE